MQNPHASSLSSVQVTMLVLGVITVLSTWALFIYQSVTARSEALAARFGGDEFVVLLAGERRERDIEDWARELARRLSSPYELDGTELKNSPSIGIAIAPRDGQALDELIRCAGVPGPVRPGRDGDLSGVQAGR